eukprot:g4270.t1
MLVRSRRVGSALALLRGQHGYRLKHGKSRGRNAALLDRGAAAIQEVPEGKGRGVVAKQRIGAGALVLTEAPVANHRGQVAGVCDHCLKRLVPGAAQHEHGGLRFCSARCKDRARRSYGRVLAQGPADAALPLEAYCREQRLKFPLLALRMAAASLCAREGFDAYWRRVGRLCFATVEMHGADGIPAAWHEEHALLRGALAPCLSGDVDGLFEHALGIAWYARLVGRLHLNTFRVYGHTDAGAGGGGGVTAAALSGGAGLEQAGASFAARGTGLYLRGAMFNHSCTPNVEVSYPRGDNAASFVTTRAVRRGEELCISYIAAEQPRMTARQRQEALEFSHGFTCLCPRCRAGLDAVPAASPASPAAREAQALLRRALPLAAGAGGRFLDTAAGGGIVVSAADAQRMRAVCAKAAEALAGRASEQRRAAALAERLKQHGRRLRALEAEREDLATEVERGAHDREELR